MSTTLYNPANKRKDQLIKEFVVRTKVFDSIMKDIISSKYRYPEQHYLIVGQRGSGKTTLLHRIKYAIEDNQDTSKIIPLSLGEEQYGISELTNLWERVSEILEDYYGFKKLSKKIDKALEEPNHEEECFKTLITALNEHDKYLLLFIDNFGDLLKKFTDLEIKRFREILMTCKHLRLIAASPVVLEEVLDYQKPLFEFFKTISLKGLTNKEIKKLLLKLAELNNSTSKIKKILANDPERIEVLRLLTGGIARTIVLLYNIFLDNINGNSIKDLQLTLDAVTPLYKHRMDDLPKNQQKIVDAVAKSWDATSVKDIVKRTRIESKIISAQLRTLEKNQVIEKISTTKKNHLYQIKERFFNIWYLMRYGRKYDRKRVIWLVRFLESWCSKEELENRISSHIDFLQTGEYDQEAASLLGEAYLACKSITVDLKKELLNNSLQFLPKELTQGMNITNSDLFKTAFEYYKNKEYDKAIKYALEIEGNRAFEFLTENYYRLGDFENALKYADKILETSDEGEDFGVRGAILHKMERLDEAIDSLQNAISRGFEKVYAELGVIYVKKEQFDLAEKTLKEGIKTESAKSSSSHQLAHLYEIKNMKSEAIDLFKNAIELGNSKANLCLARLFDKNDDFENASYYFKQGLEEYPDESNIGLAILYFENDKSAEGERHLLNLKNSENSRTQYAAGRIYQKYTDSIKKAIQHYKKAVNLGYSKGYIKLALAYAINGDFKNAEKSFLMAYEKNQDYSALIYLADYYRDNNKSKEKALAYVEDAEKNIKFNNKEKTIFATTLLWNNQLEKSVKVISNVIKEFVQLIDQIEIKDSTDKNFDMNDYEGIDLDFGFLIDYFIELISSKFYHVALELLKKYELIDVLKPVYFTLMHFMKEEFPSEHLKMGSEIKEVVEQIIKDVNELRISREE